MASMCTWLSPFVWVGLYQDHSDVLSYSLDCEGIECLLPLSDQVLTLEDEHDVLAIKNGAASGTRRASEVRALHHPVGVYGSLSAWAEYMVPHCPQRLEYAYTLECEATDCLVPVSDQVIALEDPDDVQEIMRGVVSGSSDAGLEDRLKVCGA
jgi:hypothetical protein